MSVLVLCVGAVFRFGVGVVLVVLVSIASVRNCEQVHTSILNLIFKQASVAGLGNLSK